MILGCDISTSKCGIALLENENNIVISDAIVFDSKFSLNQKAKQFHEYMNNISVKYYNKIESIIVEEPLFAVAFGSGAAWSTSLLQRFNGMTTYILYNIFDIEPELINPNKCRSLVGIKYNKGMTKKQKKDMVIEFIQNKFKEQFKTERTKFGNYKPTLDDKADALVLSLYGCYKKIK